MLVFDKDRKKYSMELVRHLENIIIFIIEKEMSKHLLEMARHVEYKTPEERHHRDGTIEWDMYGIVKRIGQDKGAELMSREKEIRKLDEKRYVGDAE